MITLSYYMPNESPYAVCIDLECMRFYFSYDQIIAYWTEDAELIVAENIWSRTTGKHIKRLISHYSACTVGIADFRSRLHTLMRRLLFAYNNLELMRQVEESNEKANR